MHDRLKEGDARPSYSFVPFCCSQFLLIEDAKAIRASERMGVRNYVTAIMKNVVAVLHKSIPYPLLLCFFNVGRFYYYIYNNFYFI